LRTKSMRIWFFLIAAMLLLLVMTVCSAARKKETLRLIMWKGDCTQGPQAQFAAFEKKTGIKVIPELIPSGPEGENLVRTRAATNDLPDLVWWFSGANFASINPNATLLDLTKESFMTRVDDSYKSIVSGNGRVYGIPGKPASAGAWLYNKKAAAQLGLKVPMTWAELMDNCAKVKAAGKTAVIGSFKDQWTTQLIWLEDFYYVNKAEPKFAGVYKRNKVRFKDCPAMVRSFEKLDEIYQKGYMNKDFLSVSYDEAHRMLTDGRGVYYPMATWALSNIAEKYPDKINDIGLFAQPGDDPKVNGLTMWMPWAYFISKNSKNVAAAKKCLAYLVSNEGINVYIKAEKPAGPFLVKGVKMPADSYPAVLDAMKYINKGQASPAMEFVCPVKGPNTAQICVEAGSGIKSPKEAAAAIDKDNEQYAKQLKLPGW
jgi:raffinose/stachyose/melibiose transport system substrate-binding protein